MLRRRLRCHPQPEKIWGFLSAIPQLNIEQLKVDMKDPAIQKIIELDLSDSKQLEVRQTPTFFVNGERLRRFGKEHLIQLIDKNLN